MSMHHITWALNQSLPCGPKFVLVILANYADANGYSYPSQETIAELCGLKRRAVVTHIKALISVHEIVTMARRYNPQTGYQMTPTYHLDMSLSAKNTLRGLSAKNDRPKCKKRQAKVQNLHSSYTKEDTKVDTKEDAREKTRVFVSGNGDKSNPKKSTRRAKPKDQEPEVPDWLPKSAWQEWIKHRKQLKSPMTAYAQALLIKKLDRLRAKHDPVDLLETAIVNGWKSVYEPRENGNGTRETKLSAAEQVEQASEQWYRDRHGGKTFEEQQAEFEQRATVEVHGRRIQ